MADPTQAPGSTPPASATRATDSARLATRYPSLGNVGKAPKAAASPTRAEDVRQAASEKPPAPANPADAESQGLASRYPSLNLGSKDGLVLDAPEGIDPGDPVFSDFRKAAGELGLDQGKAGRLLELHQRVIRGQEEAWDRQSEAWRKESEADPEIAAGTEDLRKLVKTYGGRELVDALGPLGNHPAVVRSFARIAAEMKKAGRL